MQEIPEFWRTEIFHPLSVHFPIALLLVAFIVKLISLISRKPIWSTGGSFLFFLGVIGLWIAVYTGNLADGIVSRKLCDPTVLKEHENSADLTAWLFTGAFIADALHFLNFPFFKNRLMQLAIVLAMTAGSATLIYTGHLGAKLVYQQAAGVNIPSSDCAEFN